MIVENVLIMLLAAIKDFFHNFVRNHARNLGGVIYAEEFCIVSILNRRFSAIDRGGAVYMTRTNLSACASSHCKSKHDGVINADLDLLFTKSVISNVEGLIIISGSNSTFHSAS